MKHTTWRWISDYEKEEKWLNEMAAKGMSLYSFFFGKYTFEETEPGKYIYQIELLESFPTSPQSVAYLRFLEDTGVVCVASVFRWVYLRKEAASGPFELYTDIDSKIKRLSTMKNLWFTFVWLEFIIAAANLAMVIYGWIVLGQMAWINLGCVVLLVVMGLLLLHLGLKPARKIKSLKREQLIRE
ncbi:DUF2812 domain-containing protein [Methanocorpusculum sp. GPch4]|uniref:DUF2812 domain-containing protein n=1 Tax=Methanocorpusculum sp. GPch4 TaxID=2527877 RepID=UPI00143303F3|nr:DUF2812 domain-containing protein [Methanocorpusculum sp. GPch4]